ncbi:MAG: PEP-CTERM sorting domain-containing protein [Burkholderiales bacterium]|nr:PEP-CTERM sorting domain-containing protein [Burkholderiales bacterium]
MKNVVHVLRAAVIGLALTAAAAPVSAATAVFDQYTVDYDDSTSFSGISFSGGGGNLVLFGWSFSPSVSVTGTGIASFEMPSFTVTRNSGWVLSGDVSVFVGNLSYFELGGVTTASTSGNLSFDGGVPLSIGGALDKSAPSSPLGYWSRTETLSSPGNFDSMNFSGGVLDLTAEGTAAITANPQNVLRIEFYATAAPIPEPGSYIMLLAGLGMIGMMVRRRMPQRR